MKKSFMNNIKNFVDSNVRQRIDRAANNNTDFFDEDLLALERQFEILRQFCVDADKRISSMLQTLNSSSIGNYTQNVQASLNNLSTNLTHPSNSAQSSSASAGVPGNSPRIERCRNSPCPSESVKFKSGAVSLGLDQGASFGSRSSSHFSSKDNVASTNSDPENEVKYHKKLPIVSFLKFLIKSSKKSSPDSILSLVLNHCSQSQSQLTRLFLSHEQTIVRECLKPLQHIIECDVPNIIKLRKLFIKSHNDLDSVQAKYNGASQKQQHQQQNCQTTHFTSTSYSLAQSTVQPPNSNKLDLLKKELDEAIVKYEQARDTYASELYGFICRELELAQLLQNFFARQADYHEQVGQIMQSSMPKLNNLLMTTPKKLVFGKPIEEHRLCTGRSVSTIIELCVHILHSQALQEEGLFRIPGSSMRIRKLKNAINAWFVTNAQNILDSPESSSQSTAVIMSVYEIFKDTAGKMIDNNICGRSTKLPNNDLDVNNHQQAISMETGANHSSVSAQSTKSDDRHDSCDCFFDVHTIAGLLKLYLRELPEPLFTHSLYQQFIDATINGDDSGRRTESIELVVRRLPEVNYDNLRLLIRFLHLLTCHRDSNKMTATNLAITMAPSLIWAPAQITSQQNVSRSACSEEQLNAELDVQNINLQMSSFGLATSLHAQIIENLIHQAELIFPGQVEFSLPLLSDSNKAPTERRNSHLKNANRLETSSPTGLSTASSSSFSSNSNKSLKSSSERGHSRKGGSMEGMMDGQQIASGAGTAIKSSVSSPVASRSRPLSMYIGSSHSSVPPPVPPAPATRSHLRQGSIGTMSQPIRATASHKPPAPPVPGEPKRRLGDSPTVSCPLKRNEEFPRGSINSIGKLNPVRPSVPPPNRPDSQPPREPPVAQARSSFRSDFESSNPVHADYASQRLPSVSPVVSIDLEDDDDDDDDEAEGAVRDDSSFDNDCISLDQSWTDCDVGLSDIDSSEKTPPALGSSSNKATEEGCKRDTLKAKSPNKCNNNYSGTTSDSKHDICTIVGDQINKTKSEQDAIANHPKDGYPRTSCDQSASRQQTGLGGGDVASSTDPSGHQAQGPSHQKPPQPPVKPPRAVSPRVTQSTPL